MGKENCLVDGKCRVTSVVYEATATDVEMTATYFGCTAGPLKLRIDKHTHSFNNKLKEHETTLSTHVWDRKRKGFDPKIKYRTVRKAQAYSASSGHCNLCLQEKVVIVTNKKDGVLNSKNEISGRCRHRAKHLLSHWNRQEVT